MNNQTHPYKNPKTNIHSLRLHGLPIITSISDFAYETRLSVNKIQEISLRSEYLYKTYQIPKKTGSTRSISSPSRELKALQAWILRNILDKLSSSNFSTGFEKNTSILDNATPHIGSNYILNIDLEDFFDSVKACKVYKIFESVGYNSLISTIFTKLCTRFDSLPQGAPTSPKLANIICIRLDSRVSGYTGPKGIVYTRYADDLTLSSNSPKKLLNAKLMLENIILDEGFNINNKKTKLLGTKKAKEVTGLIIQNNRVGIGKRKVKIIRSKIHYLFIGRSTEYSHVYGLLSYIYFVDRKAFRSLLKYTEKLNDKHPNPQFDFNKLPKI